MKSERVSVSMKMFNSISFLLSLLTIFCCVKNLNSCKSKIPDEVFKQMLIF